MDRLTRLTDTLPPTWKWDALFTPLQSLDLEWQALLAEAQRAEQEALLCYWGRRAA